MTNLTPIVSVVLLLSSTSGVLRSAEQEIYVSPQGDDANAGGLGCPVESLVQARNAARKLLAQDSVKRVTVHLLPGTYPLAQTFVLDRRDSRTTYRAHNENSVTVTSGQKAARWTKLEQTSFPFPDEAVDRIWVCDVDPDARFHTLYEGDRRLPRCRSEGFLVEMKPRQGFEGTGWVDATSFMFLEDYPPAKDYSKVNTRILFKEVMWCYNFLKIGSQEVEKREIVPDCPIGYYSSRTEDERSVFLENSPEFLDKPGEWFLDMENNRLYLWPSADGEPKDVTYPLLSELIRVEASGIHLEGITFSHGDRPSIEPDDESGQHEWVFLNKANALVRFLNSRDCVVRHCRFTAGQVGLRFDRLAQGNLVTGNHFTGLHGNCLVFTGYGPGTKDVNHGNTISENDFYGNLIRLGFVSRRFPDYVPQTTSSISISLPERN